MNKRSLNCSSYFFYYCKGSNSCGSNCNLNSGIPVLPSKCTTSSCTNGCTKTCGIACGNSECSTVCDNVSCWSFCASNCYELCSSTCHYNCGSTCDNALCRTSCDGGGNCANNCHTYCNEAACYAYCYSTCSSWMTYMPGNCSSSSCSATGRNIFYYVVLNISLKLLGVIIWVEKEKFLKNQKV